MIFFSFLPEGKSDHHDVAIPYHVLQACCAMTRMKAPNGRILCINIIALRRLHLQFSMESKGFNTHRKDTDRARKQQEVTATRQTGLSETEYFR